MLSVGLQHYISQKKKVPFYIYRNEWGSILPPFLSNESVAFLCIGTNRCTGDAYGPMVGTYLTQWGYLNVFGTIHHPVHQQNLQETIEKIPKDKKIVAIDAALGKLQNVGYLFMEEGPIEPGKGVGKQIPPVGDYHIKGIVNIHAGAHNQLLLMSTQLDVVLDMAKQTALTLSFLFPRKKNRQNGKISAGK